MILLDTNILSEAMKPHPDPTVMHWFNQLQDVDIVTSAITIGELRFGVEIMPAGKRKDEVFERMENILQTQFGDSVLPYDTTAAETFAILSAGLRTKGIAIGSEDTMIAAIARCYGATVATRNVKHFAPCGVKVVNPFEG